MNWVDPLIKYSGQLDILLIRLKPYSGRYAFLRKTFKIVNSLRLFP